MKLELKYLFDSEQEMRDHLATESRAVDAAPVVATEERTDPPSTSEHISGDTDKDGMLYDDALHSSNRAVNADGTWKARKGMAQQAKDARAAFKAGGGNVNAPEVTEEPTAMPGMTGMTGMPATKTDDAPEPVTLNQLITKSSGMLTRAMIDHDGIGKLYAKLGITDSNVFATNESLRAAMFNELCVIEPEMI